MSEGNGQRIKVTVQWVQILDNLEPAFKEKGEFVFRSVVTSNDLPGEKHESRYPASGHISISDQPVVNREIIKWQIFEGEVSDHLVIELYGEELDTLSANDHLDDYRREFSGPGHLLDRMKGYWTYFSRAFKDGRKIKKKIHRTHKLDRYVDIVERFFEAEAQWVG